MSAVSIVEWWRKRSALKAARSFAKHAKRLRHIDDDILATNTKETIDELIAEAEKLQSENKPPAEIALRLDQANEKLAETLPRKSHPFIREWVDVLAVALTVAFGLRALYLQPFKIPTSSMQPTLFGIHYIADTKLPDGSNTLPHLPDWLHYAIFSTQKANATVRETGILDSATFAQYNKNLILPRTVFNIGNDRYDLPGEIKHVFTYCDMQRKVDTDKMLLDGIPENDWIYDRSVLSEMGVKNIKLRYLDRPFRKNEKLCDGWLSLGDHLFVDRVTYKFTDPKRGDIVVFLTKGTQIQGEGDFYIKRLVGLPGDTLKIENGVVQVKPKGKSKFQPITSFGIKGFDWVYSGKGGYHGHLSTGRLSPGLELKVPEKHYFMMGDNSANSYDGRAWGFVPRQNIIGKAFFVVWPFSRRWGFAGTTPPLDVPTKRDKRYLPAMSLQ